MPKHPLRTEIARAGLDSLMSDPRYFDPDQPEHGAMVDMVQRGFQLIFDGPKDRGARRNPALTGPVPRPGLLDAMLRDKAPDHDGFESAPTAERARQGRGVMLAALKADGFPLPSGLKDEDAPAVKLPPPRGGERETPERGSGGLAQNSTGAPFPHPTPPRRPGSLSGPTGTASKPQPGQGALAVPSYRGQVFKNRAQEWADMNKSAANITGNSRNRTRAYMEIFAAEGGLKKDPRSSAFGGMTQGALQDAKRHEPSLQGITRSDQLNTPELMAKAYRGYTKSVLGKYGGPKELDNIKTPETAATVADTLFMHGTGKGAKLIKDGVIDAMNSLPVSEWKRLGLKPLSGSTQPPDTMDNLQKLDAAGMGALVRDKITDQRIKPQIQTGRQNLSPGARRRIEHFRFANP